MPTVPHDQVHAAEGTSARSSLRQCPTTASDFHPLIAHNIDTDRCVARQRDMYHKCHRCAYRGKPAGFVLDDDSQSVTADA